MANPFTKPSINLDTYERANPAEEQLNWGQIATDITKTFTDIEKNRATRKATIEKSYREQQEKIVELNNKYDTKTIQQFVNTGVMSIGEQLASQYNLLKRGLVTEADFSLTQNNASAGFKSIKSYADAYNKRMNEFTERRKTKMENGEPISSAEEAYDVETLLMFNNLNNKKLVSDRMGNLSVLTFDENGKPIEGESATVQQLEGLLFQETNNIDVTKVLEDMKNQVGKLSLDFAGVPKSGYKDLTQTQILAADTRFIQVLGDKNAGGHEQATKLLNGLVDQMVYDKFVAATYAVNNMSTAEGKAYTLGTQAEYDKFAKDNPGKENPIIVREYNKNSGMVQSFPTDEQVNKVKDWARASILGSFDASVKTSSQKIQSSYRPPSQTERDLRRYTVDMGKNVFMLTTGNASDAEAGARALASASKDIERIQRIEEGGKVTGIRIIKKNGAQETIMYKDKDAKQVQRSLYDMLVPKGKGYDYYLQRGGQVGDLSTATGGIDITHFIEKEKVVGGGQFNQIMAQSITSEEKPLGKTIGDLRSGGTQNIDFVNTMEKILNNNSLVNADFLGDFEVTYKAKGDDGINYNRVVIRYPGLTKYNIPIYDNQTLREFIRRATNIIEKQNRKAVDKKNKGGQSTQDSQSTTIDKNNPLGIDIKD